MTMNLDAEWQRVRVAPCVMAADRYSWLHPVDPREVAVRRVGSSELMRVHRGPSGRYRSRSLCVDESIAVVDVQFAIDDMHAHDRRHAMLRFFFFDPVTNQVSLHPSDDAWRLEITRSRQVLGERIWWRCPLCGRRRRFLYYFVAAATPEPQRVLGCRPCLGLTYPTRARHRCPDQDQRAAAMGNEAAGERVQRREAREARRFEIDRERDSALIAAFRRRFVAIAKDRNETRSGCDRAAP